MNDETKNPETTAAAPEAPAAAAPEAPAGAVATPPPRRLRICPFSLTPRPPSTIVDADGKTGQQVDLIACIGPQCQLWQFEAGKDPLRDGDCSFTIAAQGISNITLRVEQAFQAGVKEGREEQVHA